MNQMVFSPGGMPSAPGTRGLRGMGDNGAPPGITYNFRRDIYVYEAQTTLGTPLPASGTQTDTIQIEADADFYLQKLTYHCQAPAATAIATDAVGLVASQRIIPPVAIQITDTGSGRQMMQNPIPIPSLFGTGELPFILPNPRLFMRNSTIQVAFTNLDATNAYTVRLAFIGFKDYPM